jgi:hypothetical protein
VVCNFDKLFQSTKVELFSKKMIRLEGAALAPGGRIGADGSDTVARDVTIDVSSAGPFRPGPHGPVYPCSTLAGGKRSARQDEIEVQWKPGRRFQINGLSSRRKLLIKCRNQMRHRRAIRPISLKSSLQIVEISSFSFLFTRPD